MGDWMSPLKNIIRGYRKLNVWIDAIEYYRLTCAIFQELPYVLRRVASNQIAAVDSIHRNIAEGYCRRSIREYRQFLYIAIASTGESVSALHACRRTDQISDDQFAQVDKLAYKIENGLKCLIERLQEGPDDWNESFLIREANAVYEVASDTEADEFKYSNHPTIRPSNQHVT